MKQHIVFWMVFLAIGFTKAQEDLRLREETTITVSGTSTLHDWTMTAGSPKGSLEFADGFLRNIVFSAPVSELLGERGAAMDKKAHNALHMDTAPEIRFISEGHWGTSTGKALISGTLSIAGTDREVEIPIVISGTGPIQISGELPIALHDFSIEPPTAMFGSIVVGDEVIVHFNIIFGP